MIQKQYIMPEDYCKDFYQWPHRWMGFPEDVDCGEKILLEFIPFIQQQIKKGLTKSTINKYMDDLWVLGGEIIREVNNNDEKKERQLSGRQLILKYIDKYGGPQPYGWSSSDFTESRYIVSYNSICRRLFKFLKTQN